MPSQRGIFEEAVAKKAAGIYGLLVLAPGTNSFNIVARKSKDPAMNAAEPYGGIDMNAAHLDMQIKRDGKGVPLPLAQQDFAQLDKIEGFVPTILEIRPALSLPIFNNPA